jgi:quercetin dioxygenase-like cupin family protein
MGIVNVLVRRTDRIAGRPRAPWWRARLLTPGPRDSVPPLAAVMRFGSPSDKLEFSTMTLNVRRVVTGHDASGRAVVKIDDVAKNSVSRREGASSTLIWSTDSLPVVNDGDDDLGQRKLGTTLENGTVFRVVRYEPGVAPRRHRTDSVDYAVVMSGEIDMELDGETVTLKAGDVLVQRGTIHNWVNRSNDVAIVAFVLIAANPVTAGGKSLAAVG